MTRKYGPNCECPADPLRRLRATALQQAFVGVLSAQIELPNNARFKAWWLKHVPEIFLQYHQGLLPPAEEDGKSSGKTSACTAPTAAMRTFPACPGRRAQTAGRRGLHKSELPVVVEVPTPATS